jgi:hypothetical protein
VRRDDGACAGGALEFRAFLRWLLEGAGMSGDYQIPFDRDGNQQHYPVSWYTGEYPNNRRTVGPEWRDNEPFNDTLTYAGYGRGRSAAYFVFTRSDGKEVTMFMKDFDALIRQMVNGKVSGRFVFIKRGQNYGVKAA